MLIADYKSNFHDKMKKSQISNFRVHIWIHNEKCIQMSTNKPSNGLVILEITQAFWAKFKHFHTKIKNAVYKAFNRDMT